MFLNTNTWVIVENHFNKLESSVLKEERGKKRTKTKQKILKKFRLRRRALLNCLIFSVLYF